MLSITLTCLDSVPNLKENLDILKNCRFQSTYIQIFMKNSVVESECSSANVIIISD